MLLIFSLIGKTGKRFFFNKSNKQKMYTVMFSCFLETYYLWMAVVILVWKERKLPSEDGRRDFWPQCWNGSYYFSLLISHFMKIWSPLLFLVLIMYLFISVIKNTPLYHFFAMYSLLTTWILERRFLRRGVRIVILVSSQTRSVKTNFLSNSLKPVVRSSVRPSVCPFVRPSIRLSVRPAESPLGQKGLWALRRS